MLTGLQGAVLVLMPVIIYTKTYRWTLAYAQCFPFSSAIETFSMHFHSTAGEEL